MRAFSPLRDHLACFLFIRNVKVHYRQFLAGPLNRVYLSERVAWFGWTSAQTAMRYVADVEVKERYKG